MISLFSVVPWWFPQFVCSLFLSLLEISVLFFLLKLPLWIPFQVDAIKEKVKVESIFQSFFLTLPIPCSFGGVKLEETAWVCPPPPMSLCCFQVFTPHSDCHLDNPHRTFQKRALLHLPLGSLGFCWCQGPSYLIYLYSTGLDKVRKEVFHSLQRFQIRRILCSPIGSPHTNQQTQ